jgi:hypothetical protein
MRCVYGALAMLLVGLSLRASASENLVKNGAFDRDVSSWKSMNDEAIRRLSPGHVTWSSLDASESTTSGSMELRLEASNRPGEFEAGQCVLLRGKGAWVAFGGRLRVSSRQRAPGIATLYLQMFEADDCRQVSDRGEGIPPGLANSDRWAQRSMVQALTPRIKSIRIIARIRKEREKTEGKSTVSASEVPFSAFFDDLFVTVLSKPDAFDDAPPSAEDFFRGERASWPQQNQSYGARSLGAPVLSVHAFGPGGRVIESEKAVEITTSQRLQLILSLQSSSEAAGWERLPLSGLAIWRFSHLEGLPRRRRTVELLAYPFGDQARRPLYIETDGDGDFVEVRLAVDRDSRVRTLRARLECLKVHGIPFGPPLDGREISAEALLIPTFAADVTDHPVGEFELVARFESLDVGYWHEPVFSNPLRVRIVKGPSPCPVNSPVR